MMVERSPASTNAIFPRLTLEIQRLSGLGLFPVYLPGCLVGSQLSFAGVHLRLHIPSCFDEWRLEAHSDLATKEICDTASQYKKLALDLPSGHGLRIQIKAVDVWRTAGKAGG